MLVFHFWSNILYYGHLNSYLKIVWSDSQANFYSNRFSDIVSTKSELNFWLVVNGNIIKDIFLFTLIGEYFGYFFKINWKLKCRFLKLYTKPHCYGVCRYKTVYYVIRKIGTGDLSGLRRDIFIYYEIF